MMWNDGPGGHDWWWFGVFLMGAFMVLCMVMMVRMMSHGAHSTQPGTPPDDRAQTPERTLANRLAAGEIDIEEYERRLTTLRGGGKRDDHL